MLINSPPAVSSARVKAPEMKSITLDELRRATPDESSTPAFIPPGTHVDAQRTVSPSALAQTIATEIGEAQSLNFPFRCIGRIKRQSPGENWSYAGSGFLVGPWHLLTASHVLNGDPPGTIYKFIPAYWDGPRNGDIGFRWFEANIISTIGINVDAVTGYDYLVCELDNPLGLDWGWFGTDSSSNDSFYTNIVRTSIGYPRDLGGKRPQGNLFTIDDVENDDHNGKKIKGHGDVFNGWSGGPLYGPAIWTGDTAVGVLSGFADDGSSSERVTFAGGKEMVRLVRFGLDNWKRSAWSGWQALGGSFPAGVNPAAVSRNSSSIELFCRGLDNAVWQTFRQPDGNWSGWFQIPDPGVLSGDLAVTSLGPDHLQLFGVGTDSQMWSKWWTDADGWSGWQALGGSFPAGVNPAAVCRQPGLIELFCRSHDNAIWQNFRHPDGSSWSGWFQIPDPGVLSGDLTVVSMSPENLQLFGTGTDSQMWSKWWAPL